MHRQFPAFQSPCRCYTPNTEYLPKPDPLQHPDHSYRSRRQHTANGTASRLPSRCQTTFLHGFPAQFQCWHLCRKPSESDHRPESHADSRSMRHPGTPESHRSFPHLLPVPGNRSCTNNKVRCRSALRDQKPQRCCTNPAVRTAVIPDLKALQWSAPTVPVHPA